MPVTFGAVGDIISVVLLVKDLVATLDEARGSKAEYQAAIHELWLLDRTLLEIELLTREHADGATPELRGLCGTAKRAVARCHDQVTTLFAAHSKISEYFRLRPESECAQGDRACDSLENWGEGSTRAFSSRASRDYIEPSNAYGDG